MPLSFSTYRRQLFHRRRRPEGSLVLDFAKSLTSRGALGFPTHGQQTSPLRRRKVAKPESAQCANGRSPDAERKVLLTIDGTTSIDTASNDEHPSPNDDAIAQEIAEWMSLNEHDWHWVAIRRQTVDLETDRHVCKDILLYV